MKWTISKKRWKKPVNYNKSFGFTGEKVKQSRVWGKFFKLKVEFLTWMKDISLNNMLEKMSKGKIFKALKAFGSCNFGYI